MTVYVNEIPSAATTQYDEDLLRIVRNGDDVRLPLDAGEQQVTVADDHPEWVSQVVREHGYTLADNGSDAATDPDNQQTNG